METTNHSFMCVCSIHLQYHYRHKGFAWYIITNPFLHHAHTSMFCCCTQFKLYQLYLWFCVVNCSPHFSSQPRFWALVEPNHPWKSVCLFFGSLEVWRPQKHLFVTWSHPTPQVSSSWTGATTAADNASVGFLSDPAPHRQTDWKVSETEAQQYSLLVPVVVSAPWVYKVWALCLENVLAFCLNSFTFFEWLVSVGWFWVVLCPYIWCTSVKQQQTEQATRDDVFCNFIYQPRKSKHWWSSWGKEIFPAKEHGQDGDTGSFCTFTNQPRDLSQHWGKTTSQNVCGFTTQDGDTVKNSTHWWFVVEFSIDWSHKLKCISQQKKSLQTSNWKHQDSVPRGLGLEFHKFLLGCNDTVEAGRLVLNMTENWEQKVLSLKPKSATTVR